MAHALDVHTFGHNENVVDNYVLAYCQSYLQSYDVNTGHAHINITLSLDTYFNDEELQNARKILRDKCMDQLAGSEITKYKTRNSTTQVAGSSANARDIADGVYKLQNEDECPLFVVMDIRKLPILSPDMSDKKSLAERLMLLERQMLRMQEWKDEREKTIVQHDAKLMTRSAAVRPPPQPQQQEQPGTSNSLWSSKLKLPKPLKDQEPRQHLSSAMSSGEQTLSKGNSGDESDWQVPPAHKKKMHRNATRKKTPSLQGTATGTRFKAGLGPNRDLWIYNVDYEMQDDDLKKFIEEGGSNRSGKVHVRLWEPRYNPEWDTKRFRLTIGLSDYDRVFTSEFWPQDIGVRKYWVNFDKERNKKDTAIDQDGAVGGTAAAEREATEIDQHDEVQENATAVINETDAT